MIDARTRKHLDLPLIGLTYAVAAVGLLILYSVTHADPAAQYKKQAVGLILGSVALVTTAAIDFHLYSRFARQLYIANLLLLAIVFRGGQVVNGAARWINVAGFQFQPSEFAKLLTIITLAALLVRRGAEIEQPKTLCLSLLYVAVPAALIFKQPDLGTALVLLAIWMGMVFIAGARPRHLGIFILALMLVFAGLWYSGRIKGYQKTRVISFLHPDADPRAAGYHVYQARIAIGSGGIWGKGLMHSTQVRGGYIPEKQSDFIFTDVGEELGFVGSMAVLALYAGLIWRGARVIAQAEEDRLGRLVATGIVTMLSFHVIVNIGMNVGIMPVAGVPLPLFSAGNSNVVVTMACIGLLQSIEFHQHALQF
jgi:rod shape determining protein RodA